MKEHIVPKVKGLLHGSDYNPEQWPRAVWDDDMRLMNKARFNIATIGVFSWGELEPSEGQYEFGWLDDLMDLLATNGKYAALATPSAAMPAWLANTYPEVRRVSPDGGRMRHGRRVNYCLTSPIYREKVRTMAELLAARYCSHPALAVWHVSNEYGGACHCKLCQDAFRDWLKSKFKGDLGRLNQQYWTTYWSHQYRAWEEIEIPGGPYGEDAIMGLSLDWRRFVSDQTIDFLIAESAPLRALAPEIPVTTNLMGTYPGIDYWKLASHVDFVAWDSYPEFIERPREVRDWVGVSFTHDLNRSFKRQPFLLIESTPDSSNYYPVMKLKRPGMHELEGVQAVAHGSEGVMYFQWRRCRGSSEKLHGAVVAHDGRDDTLVFRSVESLGHKLEDLGAVRGTRNEAKVGLLYDWENAWAIETCWGPRVEGKDYLGTVLSHYRALWEAGITVDMVCEDGEFGSYPILVAPMLYMLRPGVADRIRRYVETGGIFVMTYWSAMVNENDLAFEGGFPGGLTDVFGMRVEATDSLHDVEVVYVRAQENNSLGLAGRFEAKQYCEIIHTEGAEVIATYDSEFYAGSPAVTRHAYGEGETFFVASRNDAAFQGQFLSLICRLAGVEPALNTDLPAGVTVQVRTDGENDFLFVMNMNATDQSIHLPDDEFTDLEGGHAASTFVLPGFGHRILVRRSSRVMNDQLATISEQQ